MGRCGAGMPKLKQKAGAVPDKLPVLVETVLFDCVH
jgi:hypothetical protein